jgi:hypothetical protein
MRVKDLRTAGGPPAPLPAKKPEHLRIRLEIYACRLFITESKEYPADPKMEIWLSKLVDRVISRVMQAVNTLDAPHMFAALLGEKQKYALTWHGLSQDAMRNAIQRSLEKIKAETLSKNPAAESPQVPDEAPAAICEPPLASEPDEGKSVEAGSIEQIVENRRKLLEDYKAATGVRADQRLYTAENAGIHKPQFYEWRDGRLPDKSKITRRFERFLKAKRLPVRRKSTI